MTDPQHSEPDRPLDAALDTALARALAPPTLPTEFRARLQAALSRAAEPDLAQIRSRLEQEQRERLAELARDYVRLRRRTLGTMIGGAFAAGAAAAVALPWFTAHLGPVAPLVIASAGAAVGLGIGITSWMEARGISGSRA